MQSKLMAELTGTGLHIRAVSASHIPELKTELEGLSANGMIGDNMRGILSRRFPLDDGMRGNMQTIFVIALPAPAGMAVFKHYGQSLSAEVPPTYMDYSKAPRVLEAKLNSILGTHGYNAVYNNNLPLKLLAARSGLAQYGRNNVCYVEGLGSFAYLSAYFTDMPCEIDSWFEAQRMDQCSSCALCVKSCPSGAILLDRQVIDADRCITMHNEEDAAVPYPAWMAKSAHNSLIGCMHCQRACPANRSYLGLCTEPVEFDEAETALILNGTPVIELPQDMLTKMEPLSMQTYYEPLARNLKALFDKGK